MVGVTTAIEQAVTFLFTDIEGSTQLWESQPTAMRFALARHDALMREAIEGAGGRVFKTVGDAFCATFPTPVEALAAVSRAQLALHSEPWPPETPIKVRMAVHVGPAEARDDDYFGPTLNRVARLLAVAHGGQTVFSEAAREQSEGQAPPEVGFWDLGEHRLKDLALPERVYQVTHPDLREDFPDLRSLGSQSRPNNLPGQLTAFFGRTAELASVGRLLEESRVVTLTGSGGCGKTRLAVQAVELAADRFPDGVWFVDLAPVGDGAQVSQALATLLGVREAPGTTVDQALVQHLAKKACLLVLDNCEHVLADVARLVESLVRGTASVRTVLTSREPLNIPGEAVFRVPSLGLPERTGRRTPEAFLGSDAGRLFLDRARAVSPSFEVTPENVESLDGICRHLDGIPLAIELAAARVRSLSPDQILTRLDDRFRLLVGGSRTAVPRQQTLRALVDWSYELLNDAERAVLRRLSVFAGGWVLEAGEQVALGEGVEDWEVLDLLTSLVDKSLVIFEQSAQSERYRMLETVRRYGHDKLREHGEEDETLGRHLQWVFGLASRAGSWTRSPDQREWLARLVPEVDNLWLALETANLRDEPESVAVVSWTLAQMLDYRGFLGDAAKALDAGIAALEGKGDTHSLVLAKLRYERAGIYHDFGDEAEARRLAALARERFEAEGDPVWIARIENLLGQTAMAERDYASAEGAFVRALARFVEARDPLGEAIVRNNLGVLVRRQVAADDPDRDARLAVAAQHLEESLKTRRDLGDAKGEAETLNNLGVVAFERGAYAEAWGHYRESLAIERALRRTTGIGTALANLGEVTGVLGDGVAAVRFLALAERVLGETGSPLAGAVRSMSKEWAENLDPEDAQDAVAGVHGSAIEETIDRLLAHGAPDPAAD
jgi:predicted ATPase/class 3 adenylate cyclase